MYNNYKKSKHKQKAVALGYNDQVDAAPKILASGVGDIAQKIVDIANECKIPIAEDKELVEVLSLLEINSYIPVEVYSAVAKILSHIYQKNNKSNGKKK
ncbi:MAG: EscU/YscU/HrcU family type III secretion system export apparatus switch protein [Rickettsiaceae bacterium]